MLPILKVLNDDGFLTHVAQTLPPKQTNVTLTAKYNNDGSYSLTVRFYNKASNTDYNQNTPFSDGNYVTITTKYNKEKGSHFNLVEFKNQQLNAGQIFETKSCESLKENFEQSFDVVFDVPVSLLLGTKSKFCLLIDPSFVETFLSKKRVMDELLSVYHVNKWYKNYGTLL